jgi:Na+-driven multidrug efflux pump
MAAVNVTNQVNFIYFVIINTICQAGGIYIAQFRGAGDSEGMKNAFRFKLIFAVTLAIVAFISYGSFARHLIAIMAPGNAAQKEITAIGSEYLMLISWTFLPIAVSTSIGTSFREIARPKIPLCISAAATLVNTIGNWLLIYGNLGAPRLEVKGAAYATIIARSFEVLVYFIYAAKTKAPFFVGPAKLFHIRLKLIREILFKSGMIFLSELSFASSETILIAMYNRRGGAEVIAGMAAGWTIANLFFLFFVGVNTVVAVLVGGALGGGRLDEARQRGGWLKSGAVAIGAITALPSALLSALIVPVVFSNLSVEARSNCLGLVWVILAYFPLWGLLNTQFSVSRAGGDTFMGMFADVTVNTLVFVPGAFLLSFFTSIPPVFMFAMLKLSDILKCIICHHLLRKERWVRNLT